MDVPQQRDVSLEKDCFSPLVQGLKLCDDLRRLRLIASNQVDPWGECWSNKSAGSRKTNSVGASSYKMLKVSKQLILFGSCFVRERGIF
jgi:hypothetical protein